MISEKIILGFYSDSSLNSVELSLIHTDGVDLYQDPVTLTRPYDSKIKDSIYKIMLKGDFSETKELMTLSEEITQFHTEVIKEFIDLNKRKHPKIDYISYSGHTIYQNPDEKINITLGNFEKIAKTFHIPVIGKFLQSDLHAGGRGGPLFGSFYDALTRKEEKPLGIISLGGILTMTSIGPFGELQAFDCSIGTVLLDHWIFKKIGAEMDFNGKYAKMGTIDTALLNRLLKDKYILKTPPKTVKRDNFMELYKHVEGSSLEDGAATLTAFIAHTLKKSTAYLTEQPKQWILIGGGIYNPTLVQMIKSLFKEPIKTAFDLNWQNDTLNACAYAFLAARCITGLPISYPSTTGAYEAVTGGQIFNP